MTNTTRGFTLLEILVTVVIIGVLMSLVVTLLDGNAKEPYTLLIYDVQAEEVIRAIPNVRWHDYDEIFDTLKYRLSGDRHTTITMTIPDNSFYEFRMKRSKR